MCVRVCVVGCANDENRTHVQQIRRSVIDKCLVQRTAQKFSSKKKKNDDDDNNDMQINK